MKQAWNRCWSRTCGALALATMVGCAHGPATGYTESVAAPLAASAPAGTLQGTARVHTSESLRALVAQGQLALPAGAAGSAPYFGRYADAPTTATRQVPVVLFLHGSSGLGLAAIGQWQRWLAASGIASLAPDSFALPDRVTYTSPIDPTTYEQIHALRGSEIDAALGSLRLAPWARQDRLVLAGASEGAVPVARYAGAAFAGRIVYSWSCEDNYFVRAHGTAVNAAVPVLNVISLSDPFFSPANPWLGNPAARGHCGSAFVDHPHATIVLIAGAPHTLLNLPAARHATLGFLQDVVGDGLTARPLAGP